MKVIFLGTNKGKIRVSFWPLDDSEGINSIEYEQLNPNTNKVICKSPDFFEIPVHSSEITAMCLSKDMQYLMTGDEDGNLFMLKIKVMK
jgi:hypothetical protein